MDNLNQKILECSARYLGVKEIPGPLNNQIIVDWLSACGLKNHPDSTAWCAAAMNGILRECGLNGTNSPAARSFQKWGIKVQVGYERPGDIMILKRGEIWQGHVGIFLHWVSEGHVMLRGGNQKDCYSDMAYCHDVLLDIRRAKLLED